MKKFSIKDFINKCDQIRRKLQIWSHFLEKFVMENFIFCAVIGNYKLKLIQLELIGTKFKENLNNLIFL